MRWEALFDDLEAQWSAQQAHQLEADVAQAVEWERAQILLVDRLRASVGMQLQLRLRGGSERSLLVHRVGADWVSGHAGAQSLLIPVGAIVSVEALPSRVQSETTPARRLLGIGTPLRALARSREAVTVEDPGGELGHGVITRVGADHLDVSVPGASATAGRRQSRRRTIALASVVLVRSM